MLSLIAERAPEIAELCRRFQVRRLEVFGSAADDDDFDPERSDVDFLVEFDPDQSPMSLTAFLDLRDQLARVVGRRVDLVAAGGITNPYIRAAIERSRQPVYAA